MFKLGDRIVISASDVTSAAECEFAFLRKLDEKLGRDVTVPRETDAMRARAAELGNEHEARQLQRYIGEFGADRVAQIASVRAYSEEALRAAEQATLQALTSNAKIVFQATFFDPEYRTGKSQGSETTPTIAFVGFADFLWNTALDGGHLWQVQDTKLARRARTTALLQLAAYAEQIKRLGVAVNDTGALLLGDGTTSAHDLREIAPLFRSRRDRVIALIDESWQRPDGHVTPWPTQAPTSLVRACGRCEVCEPEVARYRDVLLTANLNVGQRGRLLRAGIDTIDQLAAALPDITAQTLSIEGISQVVLERLAWQASLQIEGAGAATPPVRLIDEHVLAMLPAPNPGDLFFDFEGDPMHLEHLADGSPRWGLDYLFGMVDDREVFTAFWAHTQEQERQALEDFLEFVTARRRRYPGMKIYHYASYERTHLLSIAARHGSHEEAVDDLLRDGVLVDLYPIVRRALRIGSRSYSIKKLEPLYMGAEFRDEEGITDGGASVVAYARARQQLLSDDLGERARGEATLQSIADYNTYDCVSTRRLRNWLRSLTDIPARVAPAVVNGVTALTGNPEADPLEISPVGERLMAHADQTIDARHRRAAALAASAIDYYQREHKSYWWEHFARLADPIEDWAGQRDIMIIDPGHSSVEHNWHLTPRARRERRSVRLRGELAPGTSFSVDARVFAVYDYPPPFAQPGLEPGHRAAREVNITEVHADGITITETLPDDAPQFARLPLAITPGPPPRVEHQKAAIAQWGEAYADSLDTSSHWQDPVKDVLLRAPVRSADEAVSDARTDIDRVTQELLRLEGRALAVQGPPGTGKTYLAAHVMKHLVTQHGWKIGVVAQSHKVVEHVLDAAVAAGVDPSQVGKTPKTGDVTATRERASFTVLPANGQLPFLTSHGVHGRGCIVGGTAWDFSNPARFDRRSLDLLVIDEAGQFSLAPTIASSMAARRLLLLGDPQQLPQVTQGTHPEPIDMSALGWLIGDHDTLPAELGFFLPETRRMRPELARVISRLAYSGELRAHDDASKRIVTGAGAAGITWHPVEHLHNATFSPEEADEVVRIVRASLAGVLHEEGRESRPLTQDDLIVVAAYNAQVECVTRALVAAGIDRVRVGTVDRFQGQEAVISIVTLAASSPEEIPRGIEFLLMRNRLNVALSRAQWAAHLVSSPALSGSGIPSSLEGVRALAGYLYLLEEGTR